MPKTIDVNEFIRVYESELPVNVERVNKSLKSAQAKAGVQPLATLAVSTVSDTVCTAWPMIRKLINTVLKYSWILNFLGKDIQDLLTHAPEVKAFLTAIDKTVMPAVCGKGDTNVQQ